MEIKRDTSGYDVTAVIVLPLFYIPCSLRRLPKSNNSLTSVSYTFSRKLSNVNYSVTASHEILLWLDKQLSLCEFLMNEITFDSSNVCSTGYSTEQMLMSIPLK